MDWNLIRSLLDANLDQVLAKASDPSATLTALSRKISAAIEMVEGHIAKLDERAIELPALLGTEEAMLAKVDAVIAKAEQEGRADLANAAKARRAKHQENLSVLTTEQGQNDGERTRAEDALAKLNDRVIDVDARNPAGAPDPLPASAPAPSTASSPARAPAPAPTPAKKPSSGNVDDEFAALMKDMNVSLDEVELPKKKAAPATSAKPVPKDDDLGIPDLVDVKDGDTGEEDDDLPVFANDKYNLKPDPKPGQKGAPPAKGAPAKAAPPAVAKPVAPAPTSARAPAKPGAPAPASAPAGGGSKKWLWISSAVVALGGAGAAVAHFALHLF